MTTILDRLLDHNLWTTRELLRRCDALTAEQFSRRIEIGPGSLHDTFAHVIECMQRWAARIENRELPPPMPEIRYTARELLELLEKAGPELRAAADRIVAEERLDEVMHMTYQDRIFEFTRGTALAHVLTHGMHHRAQIIHMLKRLDVPCDLDGDVIEWEIAERIGQTG